MSNIIAIENTNLSEKPKTIIPDWAKEIKKKNQEIRCRGGNFYLYEISSVYDPAKKRAKKITGEYLGKITEDNGLIPKTKGVKGRKPKDKIVTEKTISEKNDYSKIDKNHEKQALNVSSKKCLEFGATSFIHSLSGDIIDNLKKVFPNYSDTIISAAICRLIHQSPLKNMKFLYDSSIISQNYKDAALRKNSISQKLSEIGDQKNKISDFMKNYINGSDFLLFDLTNVICKSSSTSMNMIGYNSKHEFDPQVNLFYFFDAIEQMPVYYRVLPGNISGMSALIKTIREAEIKNAILIGDKGFFTSENIDYLHKTSIDYILPLRRNSSLFDYKFIETKTCSAACEGYFQFNKRPVFHKTFYGNSLQKKSILPDFFEENKFIIFDNSIYSKDFCHKIQDKKIIDMLNLEGFDEEICTVNLRNLLRNYLKKLDIEFTEINANQKIVVFIDKSLEYQESSSYLNRINENMEGYTYEEYIKKEKEFGTIAMISNLVNLSPEKIYQNYKKRGQIEDVFDVYKNLLHADRSYMQKDSTMYGWMFINHIALLIYYKIYNLLKNKNLLAIYSVNDILLMLSRIQTIKLDEKFELTEINSKTKKLLKNMKIDITQFKMGS